jgi:CheY-like chemotaxis protein
MYMNTLIRHQGFSIQPALFTIGKLTPFKAISQQFKRDSKNIDMGKLKILVVEDESINQRVAQLALENIGYQVDIAATGQAALTLYQANHYAAILMDIGLPDTKGTEVTRQIRELEQTKGIHTPIIALTAHGTVVKNECLAAGMDNFTTKPIGLERLNQLIKKYIEKLS